LVEVVRRNGLVRLCEVPSRRERSGLSVEYEDIATERVENCFERNMNAHIPMRTTPRSGKRTGVVGDVHSLIKGDGIA